MHPKPIPTRLNISLYTLSIDLVLVPISPFLILVICLSNKVVSKKVIASIAMLKLVIDICIARKVTPYDIAMKIEMIKNVSITPAKTCFEDLRISRVKKYARRAMNVVEMNDTVILFFCILYILTLSNLSRLT